MLRELFGGFNDETMLDCFYQMEYPMARKERYRFLPPFEKITKAGKRRADKV